MSYFYLKTGAYKIIGWVFIALFLFATSPLKVLAEIIQDKENKFKARAKAELKHKLYGYTHVINALTDEQKAAQMLLVYYTSTEFALKHEFGGVLLMQKAFKNPQILRSKLEKLKRQSKITSFVAIDHEGGKVNRLKSIPGRDTTLSAYEMGRISADEIETTIEKVAGYLSEMGINLNLAPVLDPHSNFQSQLTWMGKNKRSLGNTNEKIIPRANAVVRIFKRHGILSIVKHFPGYTATNNSDKYLLTVATPKSQLAKMHYIFKATAEQAAGTMLSNITYSSVSDTPAVLTNQLVNQARQIYPQGLLVTDDLWADGIRNWGKTDVNTDDDTALINVTKAAILAGNDILMVTYPKKAVLLKTQIAKWMKNDPEIRQAVNQANRRILKTKSLITH